MFTFMIRSLNRCVSSILTETESVIRLSEPGEIRKEYENELQRYRKELIEEKKKELAASEKYIINLYKQEGIIDLVDSSDHLSISSSTSTPEHERNHEDGEQQKRSQVSASDVHELDDDEVAGPSGSAFTQPKAIAATINCNQLSNSVQQSSNVISSNQVSTSRPETSKSVSNGSVISISSTSSASAASSSCISSTSSRYSLIKSAQQTTGGGHAEAGKQKHSILNKFTTAGGSKKVFTMADLNKSELCVKPTKLHRKSPSNDDDDDPDDGDSLRSELNHFKPIIATTPKSCFSPKAIIRVPSIRPENAGPLPLTSAGATIERLSPSKSPFKPIDPTTPRRSAFSVVNVHLLTPPTTSDWNKGSSQQQRNRLAKKCTPHSANSPKDGAASTTKRQTNKKKRNSQKKAKPTASQRKRKLEFSPQPNSSKVKPNRSTKATTEPAKPHRLTRQSFNSEALLLKELIVTDQQRRAAMIEQERRDFEFAQKLQKKLNRTRGAAALLMEPFGTSSRSEAGNNAYSLRQKVTFTTVPDSVSYFNYVHNPVPEPSRKRKSTAVQSVTAGNQDKTTQKQVGTGKTPKLIKQEPVDDTTAAETGDPVRRSTRNRH
ncbi:uncharacterized protein LOC129727518 isoform X2 [Wyeomyia smithii]|uniref:uncharacterized protein LOC129727518 isoform X2 n=1 Tax=Wyeomyia smithii TaxID=174621 RepID=UPI002467ADDD|nr:uncharacterized protein LOC129727518 isoform X2 [Wyeomyia smithii]